MKRNLYIVLCVIVLSFVMFFVPEVAVAKAEEIKFEGLKNVKSFILVDGNSDTVIFDKESTKKLPIASMTKLISLGVIFNCINEGKLNLEQELIISENAASMEGSEAFLDAGKKYNVEDLIKTVIILSANDSTVALAEACFGSEDAFVEKMNELSDFLGMNDSHFTNSTGLPAVSHYSTARDLVLIYKYVKNNHIYKKYAKTWIDELNHSNNRKTGLVNTNRLVKSYSACTGGKTGFTNEAGYCLTASAKKGEMELIGVVIGAKDSKDRFSGMIDLFDTGFSNFENRVIVKKDQSICKYNVVGAKEKSIDLYPKEDYVKFLKKGQEYKYSIAIDLFNKKAPLKESDKLGVLMVLDENNIVEKEIDLVANRRVEKIKLYEILDNIYLYW